MAAGKIYLIPVTLGNQNYNDVIPQGVLEITRSLRLFAVENIRSARRYLRLIDKDFPIDETEFLELSEHTGESEISKFLEPVGRGKDMGLMSEAGLPGIADPGAMLISAAHRFRIRVIPLSGPSSIILSLISSGLNGQNFTFNGYLPVRQPEREATLKALEKKGREGKAQIFIETPYRNQRMLDSILSVCSDDTLLCIATNITLPGENIRTMTVSEWRRNVPSIDDQPTVFVIQ
ncbi:MAG: SAM-dependent methyltransferase [Bacteroidales bacterium]|jgi:16S rRNA (cytidine1402-2'-O)-methyltransferase|nr:SAM-dependent methyltransferase [Bacteroidales bacterium]